MASAVPLGCGRRCAGPDRPANQLRDHARVFRIRVDCRKGCRSKDVPWQVSEDGKLVQTRLELRPGTRSNPFLVQARAGLSIETLNNQWLCDVDLLARDLIELIQHIEIEIFRGKRRLRIGRRRHNARRSRC